MPLGVTHATRLARNLVDRARRHEATSIEQLTRSAARWPERTAVFDDAGSVTLAELHERVHELAGALHARGVRPGSTVGLLCGPHAGLVEAAFAAAWLGAEIVQVDVDVTDAGLADVARDGSFVVLVHDADVSHVVRRAELSVTTLVSDAHGSGSVTAARSFGHPAPRHRRSAARSSRDVTDLDAVLIEVAHGRSVVLTRTSGD